MPVFIIHITQEDMSTLRAEGTEYHDSTLREDRFKNLKQCTKHKYAKIVDDPLIKDGVECTICKKMWLPTDED